MKTKGIIKSFFRGPVLKGFFSCYLFFGKILPRRFLLFLGRGMGRLAYMLFPGERKKAFAHLSRVLPKKSEKEIKNITKRVFINIGMNFAEFTWIPRLKKKNLDDIIEFKGIGILKKLKKANKPVLIITGHIGNWELMAAAAALKGFPSSVIARRQKNRWINDKMIEMRKKWNVETIMREEKRSSKKILSILKNGGFLATLMDQDTNIESVFVDFFSNKAYTPAGPAAISLRSGCEVVLAYIHRNGNMKHNITFKYITPIVPTGNKEIDIVNRTQQFTSVLEDAIRKNPDQWVWMHKRWKTQKISPNQKGR